MAAYHLGGGFASISRRIGGPQKANGPLADSADGPSDMGYCAVRTLESRCPAMRRAMAAIRHIPPDGQPNGLLSLG